MKMGHIRAKWAINAPSTHDVERTTNAPYAPETTRKKDILPDTNPT